MGRSGYSDDFDGPELWLYRGAVESALKGKRGQQFLRDLIAALDRLPEKRLIEDELQADGEVCAIGSVGLMRGIDMTMLDPSDCDGIARVFNIAPSMVREIESINDNDFGCTETPERRFQSVRDWALSELKDHPK